MIHLLIDDDKGLAETISRGVLWPLTASEALHVNIMVPKYDSLAYYYLCGRGR